MRQKRLIDDAGDASGLISFDGAVRLAVDVHARVISVSENDAVQLSAPEMSNA
ncbi:MAG TPA: hypothetical protein PLB55_06760 [Prosthecobacter sp.]|nr:hypothetical protein [Prosthecobacter sp.]